MVSLQPWIWSARSCEENRASEAGDFFSLQFTELCTSGQSLGAACRRTNRPPEISLFLVLSSALTQADLPASRPLHCKGLFQLLPALTLVMLGISLPLVFALSSHCEVCCRATVAPGLASALRSLGLPHSSTVWEDPCYISMHGLQPLTLLRS